MSSACGEFVFANLFRGLGRLRERLLQSQKQRARLRGDRRGVMHGLRPLFDRQYGSVRR